MSASVEEVGAGSEYVRLDVPAATEQLRLVRLVVVGLATAHGADVDDLEDLRIAAGEVCAHLVGRSSAGDRLVIDASVSDGATPSVRVSATVEGLQDASELDELSAMVLDTTTERYGVRQDADAATAWFERPVSSSGDAGAAGRSIDG